MNCREGLWVAAVFSLVALALHCDSLATVRHVPAEYPAIQAAVYAASVGDTVLVAPGAYFENVLIDRRVALLSEAGAEVTTIDGQDLAPVIFVQKHVDHAVIEGFRVTHGSGWPDYFAAGIDVDIDFTTGGYATIRRNIVEYNYCPYGAGGIYSIRQSIVEDNIIQYNNQKLAKGISAMEVSGKIERNIVRYNGVGGDLQVVLVRNTDTFAWNLVVDNYGGYSTVRFGNGGSIHNNTIAGNDQAVWTVDLRGPIPYDFSNNLIVHGNWPGLNCSLNGSHVIRCNDVWGAGQSYTGDCAGMSGVDGNFSADPLFCDTPNGDYRISSASPCAPLNTPQGCGLVGALDVGCGSLAVDGGGAASLRPKLVIAPNPVWYGAGVHLSGLNQGDLVDIYDLGGRAVDLVGPILSSPVQWHPDRHLPSGVYFARIRGAASVGPTRFVLVR